MFKKINDELIINTDEIKMVRIKNRYESHPSVSISYFDLTKNKEEFVLCDNIKEAIELVDLIYKAIIYTEERNITIDIVD